MRMIIRCTNIMITMDISNKVRKDKTNRRVFVTIEKNNKMARNNCLLYNGGASLPSNSTALWRCFGEELPNSGSCCIEKQRIQCRTFCMSLLAIFFRLNKQMNANYGHLMGERYLKAIADGIKKHIQKADFAIELVEMSFMFC